jgi:hypothetical protein
MGKAKFFAKRSDNNKSDKLFTINQGKSDINVTFSVDDNGKKSDLFSYIVKGSGGPLPTNFPPIAKIIVQSNASVGDLVPLDGSGSSDQDGTISNYLWELVGATTSQPNGGSKNSFIFPPTDQVTVKLTVTDNQGATGTATSTIVKKPITPPPTPIPIPPPTPTGNVIYDSNVDGKWNNGVARVVKDEDGDVKANGKGIFTAASGSPEVRIDGKGVATLVTKPGFGRFYLCVNNFNAQLDFDFNIQSASVDNMSIKGRSRHQAGGACENRFGGLGNATSLLDTDFKIEVCHNVHEQGYDKTLPTKLIGGNWYTKRYIYQNTSDNKGIHMEDWIDFKDGKGLIKVFERTETKPKPHYMDKATFMKESWIWFRLNGSGSIAFKNVKVTDLG